MLFSNMARLTGSENNNESSGTGNKTTNGNSSNGDSTGHNYTPCAQVRPPHLPSLDLSLHTSSSTRKSAPNSLTLTTRLQDAASESNDFVTFDLDSSSSSSPHVSADVSATRTSSTALIPGLENLAESGETEALQTDLKEEFKALLFSEHFWSMGNVSVSQQQQLHDMVEKSISQTSMNTVDRMLQQVSDLSNLEKLLLVLKLRNCHIQEDPLRLPVNPLGSRPEISLTVTWISTHLEEDASTSLPKHEVYEEYMTHCQANNAKALSTADFGKVMKQVFPTVRPRRLGTRGHSRYCYSGLRKRMKVNPPLLPDLDTHSSAGTSTEDILQDASSCVIREWSEKLLTSSFPSTQALAVYLVDKLYVDHRSKAAKVLLELTASKTPVVSECPDLEPLDGKLRTSCASASNKAVKGSDKEHMRELKRKLQEQHLVATKNRVTTGRTTKKTKVSGQAKDPICSENESNELANFSTTSESAGNSSRTASLNSSVVTPPAKESKKRSRKNQDKAPTTIPNLATGVPQEEVASSAVIGAPVAHNTAEIACRKIISPVTVCEAPETLANASTRKKCNPGKVAIPRLHSQRQTRAPPALPSIILVNPAVSPQTVGKKYVPIQPKYKTEPEESATSSSPSCQDSLSHLTIETSSSIKRPFKEADEELMRYLGNPNDANDTGLGQLRALLEQNLSEKHVTSSAHIIPSNSSTKTVSEAIKDPLFARRRVSFDTLAVSTTSSAPSLVADTSSMHAIPPSPNTRRKAFNFTPISPRNTPISDATPSLRNLLSSQSSSSNNPSPFVSPRTTPGPEPIHANLFLPPANAVLSRSRHNSASSLLVNRARHSSGASVTLRHAPYPSNPYATATNVTAASQEHEAALARSRHNSAGSPKSAPLSPLVTSNDMLSRAPGSQPAGDLRRRHMSAGTILGQNRVLSTFQTMVSNNPWNDPFSHEIEKLLAESTPVPGPMSTPNMLLRSQSVPLHTMGYNPAVQMNPTFHGMHCAGFSSQDNSSHSYSPYTPTPVPSDWADFSTSSNDAMMSSHASTVDPTSATAVGSGTAEGSEDDAVALESFDAESLRELVNQVYASESLDFNHLDTGVMGNELVTAHATVDGGFGGEDPDRNDPLDAAVLNGLGSLGNEDVVAALMSLREVAPGNACDLQRLVQDVSHSED